MTLTIRPGVNLKPGVTVIKPLPAVSYAVSPGTNAVDEGSAITFNVSTTAVPNGTTLYWSIQHGTTSNADFTEMGGSFQIVNGSGSFSVHPVADNLTEGTEDFYVAVRTGSTSGTIVATTNSSHTNINDTSLSRPHWTDGDATASGAIVTYRYYKFHITKTRSMPPTLDATQISELIILNGSSRLPGGTASNPSGHTGANEGPNKAFDGYYDTKICDQYFTTNGNSSTIIVDYTSAQSSNGFTFATADDSPSRDPVQWTFEGSNDGSTWTLLHEQLNDADVEYQRNRLAGIVFNYQAHGSALISRAEGDYLSVAAGSQFNLGTTWTIEFWLYMNGPSADIGGSGIQGIVDQGGWYYGLPNNSMLVGLAAGKLTVCQGTSTTAIEWTEPTPQQWVHVAVVNNAGIQKAYYNGIEQIKVGDNGQSGNYTNTNLPVYIGSLAPAYGSPLDGKLTNLRITNTAVYTANFYPPTVKPDKIAGTRLLWTPTDQSLITDNSDSNATMTNNGASYSSSYPAVNNTRGSALFGSSSYMKVGTAITAPTTIDSGNSGGLPNPPSPDGTGSFTRVNLAKYPDISVGMTFVYDNITFTVAQVVPQSNHFYDDLGLVTFYPRYNGTIPSGTSLTFVPSQPFALGTTWTIEWWSKATSATVYHGAGLYTVMSAGAGNNLIDIYYQDGFLHAGNSVEICAEPPAGEWTHVAMVTTGGSTQVYYNGIAQTVNSVNYNLTDTNHLLYIGCRGSNLFQNFVGKLTNIRITNTAVYTTNFIPDQLPTVISGHTKLLYTPTVDTIYGVDTGDYSLPIINKSVTYSSDYPPQTHQLTVTQNHENDGSNSCITRTAGADAIPIGATMVLNGTVETVIQNNTFNDSRAIAFDPPVTAGSSGFYADQQYTFTWYT